MTPGAMATEVHASILLKLAEQVISARKLDEVAENLMQKPLLLHRYVLQTPINWKKIADELSEDRSRIYHWYRETHSRSILNIRMTSEDRRAIKEMIIAGIKDRSILSPGFYGKVRERFGVKYPRQELRMTYNNALRTQGVRAALEEYSVVLPQRRTYNQRIKKPDNEALASSMAHPSMALQAPYMLNYAAPPPMQAIGTGGQVFMNSMPIMSPLPGMVSPFLQPNAPGYFVACAPQPGFIANPGTLPLQMVSTLPQMQISQPTFNSPASLTQIPLIASANSGIPGPYCGSAPPFASL